MEMLLFYVLIVGAGGVDVEEKGGKVFVVADLPDEGEGIYEFLLGEVDIALIGEEPIHLSLGLLHVRGGTGEKHLILEKSGVN